MDEFLIVRHGLFLGEMAEKKLPEKPERTICMVVRLLLLEHLKSQLF